MMLCLHVLESEDDSLAKAVVGFGVVEPFSGRVFDLYSKKVVNPRRGNVVALLSQGGVYFAPDLKKEGAALRRANPKPIPLRSRRSLETDFISGYTAYARDTALFWRNYGVSEQVILCAGVFALASVQTGIANTLRLTSYLHPYLVENELPDRKTLVDMCVRAGVGLQESRPDWFLSFQEYAETIDEMLNQEGLRDDELRRVLSLENPLPKGLSITKLSFILALIGNNTGCLDARVLNWAFGDNADQVAKAISKKTERGTVSVLSYLRYEDLEDDILTRTPYFNPEDPLGLARSQWMLWEQLGKSGPEYHDHQEFFDAVVDPRFFWEIS